VIAPKRAGTGICEHYDDSAGNTVSGKASTRYELLRGLAIRGGITTGFRAPSLAQPGFSTTQPSCTSTLFLLDP
jgi:iron complex outermembrane recepter protein